MPPAKRYLPFLALACIIIFIFFYGALSGRESWRALPQAVGLGDKLPNPNPTVPSGDNSTSESSSSQNDNEFTSVPTINYRPGKAMHFGYNYTRLLVMPRTKAEDVTWLEEHLPDLQAAIYVADDPTAPLHPPKNKGHEVMIYLTYIIEHYDELPDVCIFMHAHRYSWHNDDILNHD